MENKIKISNNIKLHKLHKNYIYRRSPCNFYAKNEHKFENIIPKNGLTFLY